MNKLLQQITAIIGLLAIHFLATATTIADFLHQDLVHKPPTVSPTSAGEFIISPAGNIRFLQAFFYSDTSCTTRLGVGSITDNGEGYLYTSEAPVWLDSSSAYKLANNQGITTGNIQCMQLYLNGGNQSFKGVSCQNFTDEACTGTACVSGQSKTVTWAANPSPCATISAYISNANTGEVTKCTVHATTGALSACAPTETGFGLPIGVATNNTYALVADRANSSVVSCAINASGELFGCNSFFTSFSAPSSVTISGGYAYVTNGGSDSISVCAMSPSTGALSGCNDTTGSGFNEPTGVSINEGYLYVVNQAGGNVSKCTVSPSTGLLSSCAATATGFGGFSTPNGIGVANGYAYILNSGGDIVKCTVNPASHELDNCASALSGLAVPNGVGLNNGHIYITVYNGNLVKQCDVDAVTGAISGCSDVPGFNGPAGNIAFY